MPIYYPRGSKHPTTNRSGGKIASDRGETPERACEKQVDVLMNVRDALVSLYDH